MQRTSERAFRARFRLIWEVLTYQEAHDILSAASKHPVTLVPRTQAPGDLTFLQEHIYQCRVLEELSGATPLFRRGPQGSPLARVVLEIESLGTYERIPNTPQAVLSGAEASISLAASTAFSVDTPEIVTTATDTIAVAAEAAALTEAEPPSESLAGAEAAVSLTETTEYVVELLVQATEAVQPAAEAAALTTQGPGAETLTGAEAQV
jgi:hypothetical protein